MLCQSDDEHSISKDSVPCSEHNPESEEDGWINHPGLLNDPSKNQPSKNVIENDGDITAQDL